MLISTQSSFPINDFAFIEHHGHHFMENINSFTVNEYESLIIDRIDVPSILENNENEINFHAIFHNLDEQNEEPNLSFDYSKGNSEEKIENHPNEQEKFNNSSNDELSLPLNGIQNLESNSLNEPKKDKKSSLKKIKKDIKKIFEVIYPKKMTSILI